MLFMVIEHFKDRDAKAVYSRFNEKGRMTPEGLRYIGSWTTTTLDRCFQMMECDDPALFEQWTAHWQDLIEFEIIPVMTGSEAAKAVFESEPSPQ
ncbi:MAG TPA: DUF3303 family protein [Ktedonosporobacter sp.]|nr:DUF3303 family protein [Ktedonosporobacter sp.]